MDSVDIDTDAVMNFQSIRHLGFVTRNATKLYVFYISKYTDYITYSCVVWQRLCGVILYYWSSFYIQFFLKLYNVSVAFSRRWWDRRSDLVESSVYGQGLTSWQRQPSFVQNILRSVFPKTGWNITLKMIHTPTRREFRQIRQIQQT